MTKSTVGLRLDDQTQNRLKKLGVVRDRSPHYLMKQAVEQFLSREEEIEAEDALLNARWDKFALTGESYSHDEAQTRIANMIKSRRTQA